MDDDKTARLWPLQVEDLIDLARITLAETLLQKSALAEFTLFPHVEIFNCKASASTLSATIPENPQSSAEPGPPFSFWGRGVIADYRIYPDPSARGLDLSKLTALKLSISCIGFARQGAAQSPPKVLKPVPVLLPGRTFASTSGIVHRANA